MAKRSLIHIIAIGLLLTGCVGIPDLHGTTGHYNESGDINTECFTADSILPGNTSVEALQVDALNFPEFQGAELEQLRKAV